ncbi:ABC transporter permease [Streptomyces sp. TS71-3]|uniref:ABC transporter permease n=1 Tax=Streptomyces sp. TS71-3 TaxID=2733862 RepID=UPI001B0A2916|nr:ABC transporter permease [Streptomyces sp. TS71-3]GHJ38963.1 ABC transporter permease [Streptomyces sp. TS71-3]
MRKTPVPPRRREAPGAGGAAAGPVLRFVLRRLAAGLLVLWGAATLAFLALHLVPGDIVDTLLGPSTTATPALRAQIRADYGLDQPLPVQYAHTLASLATGDLGRSYQLGQPVTGVLSGQVVPTVELALAACATALLLAFAAAYATAGRGRAARTAASGVELLATSVPSFWLGILGLTFLSYRWHLLPATGADGLASLLLPAVTLALPIAGVLAQVIRQELDLAASRPFVLTARSRGASGHGVFLRHTGRHAALPVATLAGWITGSLLSGAVLTETVFARPGLGRVLVTAVTGKDIPVVSALVVLSAAAFVVVNLLVDLLYLAIDPRLRTEAPV